MATSTSSLKGHGGRAVNYSAIESDTRSACSVDDDEPPLRSPCVRSTRYPLSLKSAKKHFASEVDGLKVTVPLIGYSFMTGYIDAISFSTIFVWCGFQTGNFAQLALAVARNLESCFFDPRIGILTSVTSLPRSEQQSMCSIAAFALGLATFGRLGDRIGTHKRSWLFCGTLVQAILTLASAATFWNLEGARPVLANVPPATPSPLIGIEYFFCVACLSASFGVQGIMARRLNTNFGTTVVLTGVFVELVTEPTLFQVTRSVRSRDEKWMAAVSLFVGVVVGRLILGQLGTALTIGVGAMIRVLIAVSWLCIPTARAHLP